MAPIVAGDMYMKLDGQLHEIKRQIRQPGGYPFDPEKLGRGLQRLIEGDFEQTDRAQKFPERVPDVESQPEQQSRVEILREKPKPCAQRTVEEHIAGMQSMYKMLGWTWAGTTSGLAIPERRKGFDRLIVVGNVELTNNRVYDACKASFPSWCYAKDLDVAIPSDSDERHPRKNGVYAVWFRDRVEADDELRSTSADMIREKGLKTITFLERELMELVYFMETGEHLDICNWTLCSGSCISYGRVPYAGWSNGWFWVSGVYSSSGPSHIRSREAVTL